MYNAQVMQGFRWGNTICLGFSEVQHVLKPLKFIEMYLHIRIWPKYLAIQLV